MNSLYVLASVGFCVASEALITSASALPSEEIPKTEPEYISQGEDRRPGVGREQRDDHDAAAEWVF
jgi:hypothetical protein